MSKEEIKTAPDQFENIDDEGGVKRNLKGFNLKLVAGIAICWTVVELRVSILALSVDFFLWHHQELTEMPQMLWCTST